MLIYFIRVYDNRIGRVERGRERREGIHTYVKQLFNNWILATGNKPFSMCF